ncbi:MauE/DoxX family redox-associated membrane protein [Nitriliruptor alkaliphilus]|uniref:MauE/DoxX family redox-associated membrane protein n=1 Tax=Nitriliruptor alkaliphilus TaxID=427918 RepID=UPI000698437B|nr:MauE/DoxX family redox-associated membrane protein [Nitriliruptor alkaliphilus]
MTLTLAVLVALAAGLLVPAGIAKLRAPGVARAALGLPRRTEPWVRTLGVAELGLAAAVLATAARPAVAALGVAYVAFTAVALRQRARGASCGCFGASDTPTGWHHVLLDGVAAAVVMAAAVVGVRPASHLLTDAPLAGVPLLAAGAIAVASLQLVITALPDLATARRTAGGSS